MASQKEALTDTYLPAAYLEASGRSPALMLLSLL